MLTRGFSDLSFSDLPFSDLSFSDFSRTSGVFTLELALLSKTNPLDIFGLPNGDLGVVGTTTETGKQEKVLLSAVVLSIGSKKVKRLGRGITSIFSSALGLGGTVMLGISSLI